MDNLKLKDDEKCMLFRDLELKEMRPEIQDEEFKRIKEEFESLWKFQSIKNRRSVSELYDISCATCYEIFEWSDSPAEWDSLRIPIQLPGTTETICRLCINRCCSDNIFHDPFTRVRREKKYIDKLKPADCVVKILKKSYRSSYESKLSPTMENINQDFARVKEILQNLMIRFQDLNTKYIAFKESHTTFVTVLEGASLKIIDSIYGICNSMWDTVMNLEHLLRYKIVSNLFPGKSVVQIQLSAHRIFSFVRELNRTTTEIIRLYFCAEEAYNCQNYKMVRFCLATQIVILEIQDILFGKILAGGVITIILAGIGISFLCLLNPIVAGVILSAGFVSGCYTGYQIYLSKNKPISKAVDVNVENIPSVEEILKKFKNLQILIPTVDEHGFNVAQMRFIENITNVN
jgi:hypothetical protein